MHSKVLIVIPCYNEEDYIEKCLSSVCRLEYPNELLTIAVCDGMSTDRTRDIIQSFVDKNKHIHLIDNPRRITSYGLNKGLKSFNADFKMILGAHSEISPDYVKKSIEAFKNNNRIGCTGGFIENVHKDPLSKSISKAMASEFGVGNAHFRTQKKTGFVDTVAFGMYRSEVFEKIGYFDDQLVKNQDDEFNYRVIKNGYLIWLDKNVRSKYYVRSTFKKLFRQYFLYGFWKVGVNMKHKTITTFRQLIPFLFMFFLIFFPGSFIFCKYCLMPYAGIIGVYFLLNLFFSIKKSSSVSEVFLIIWSFLILHFSYGTGYLAGLIYFCFTGENKNGKNKQSLVNI